MPEEIFCYKENVSVLYQRIQVTVFPCEALKQSFDRRSRSGQEAGWGLFDLRSGHERFLVSNEFFGQTSISSWKEIEV